MAYAAPFIWSGGSGNAGLTLTATIRDSDYVSVLSGLPGVTEIGATGTYRWYYAAFSDGFVGFVELLSGATIKAVFPVSPADASVMTLDLTQPVVDVIGAPNTMGGILSLLRAHLNGKMTGVSGLLRMFGQDDSTQIGVDRTVSGTVPSDFTRQ